MSRKRQLICCGFLSTVLLCLSHRSVHAANESERLVQELGASRFSTRSLAEEKLLNLGYGSYRAITAGASSENPEIRYRSQRLLKLLQRAAFADQHHQLRRNPWLVPEELAPGWEAFHQLLGDGEESRELYVLILNSETDLMLALNHPGWQLQFEKRCADLQAFSHQRRQVELEPGAIAALIFLASHPENQPSGAATSVVNMLLSDGKFRDAATRSRNSDVLKSLISEWIRKSRNSSAIQRLSDAAAFELDAAIDVAREIIEGRQRLHSSAIYLVNSIFYLALYGEEEVIEELEDLLDEEQQLFGSRRSSDMDVQVRDAALAALVYITDQSHQDYGFHDLRPKRGYLYIGSTAKFRSKEIRETAIEKWHNWRADHLKGPLPQNLDASLGELL